MKINVASATVSEVRDNRLKEDKPKDSTTVEFSENGRQSKSVFRLTFPGQLVDELLTGDRVSIIAEVRCNMISGLCYLQAEQYSLTKLDGGKEVKNK